MHFDPFFKSPIPRSYGRRGTPALSVVQITDSYSSDFNHATCMPSDDSVRLLKLVPFPSSPTTETSQQPAGHHRAAKCQQGGQERTFGAETVHGVLERESCGMLGEVDKIKRVYRCALPSTVEYW